MVLFYNLYFNIHLRNSESDLVESEELKAFRVKFSLTFQKIGACFTKLVSSGKLGGSPTTGRLYLWEFESEEDVEAFEKVMEEHHQNCINFNKAKKNG